MIPVTISPGCDADIGVGPVARFYAALNTRQLNVATELFATGATIEHMPGHGRDAVAGFATYWFTAFPDAHFVPRHVEYQTASICEADVVVTGTHRGVLDVGSCRFKPSGIATQVRCRQLFEFAGSRIQFSAITFDVQSLIRQLATIDYQSVPTYTSRIDDLSRQLTLAADEDARRSIANELALTVDAFRRALRPYFSR